MRYFSFLIAMVAFLTTGCLKEDINTAAGTPNPFASVEVVKNIYRGTDMVLTQDNMAGAYQVRGVVLSDAAGGNIPAGQLVLQNTSRARTRGVILQFNEPGAVPFALGDSISVDVSGATLTKIDGNTVIKGLSTNKVKVLASGVPVTPQTISLSELAIKFATYESTLVSVNADITPIPARTDTYAGDKQLFDGSEVVVFLHTDAAAAFAGNRVPASAGFTGIARWVITGTDTLRQLILRNSSDVKNASGPLYPGYPEDFEYPDVSVKGSYAAKAIDLRTGNWMLNQAILANTKDRDRFNPAGKQCIRMQQNLSVSGYLQMNYDLPNGASKVTLSYGSYYTDASSSWQLEYSTDQGATWTKIGETISDAGPVAKIATFLMNIEGPVRFRVNKLGLGTTTTTIKNGRLSIEDFAVYQN